jgi:hypothetical protein
MAAACREPIRLEIPRVGGRETGMSNKIRSFGFVFLAAAGLMLSAHEAGAIPISITDLTPTYTATIPACNPNYVNCTSTAHLGLTSIGGGAAIDAEFKKSFDAWNATNAAGSKWTLTNGGALPGGKFNVTIFDAFAEPDVGGLEISVDWTYAGADKTDYRWSQGLYDNYLLNGAIVPPFYEMDIRGGACNNKDQPGAANWYCAPYYPYQYGDRHFYDRPAGPWPNAFFEARAFLSKADFTTRALTIYEGVNYGFQLSATPVPEPLTLMLVLPGVVALAHRRWTARCRT